MDPFLIHTEIHTVIFTQRISSLSFRLASLGVEGQIRAAVRQRDLLGSNTINPEPTPTNGPALVKQGQPQALSPSRPGVDPLKEPGTLYAGSDPEEVKKSLTYTPKPSPRDNEDRVHIHKSLADSVSSRYNPSSHRLFGVLVAIEASWPKPPMHYGFPFFFSYVFINRFLT
ncbi:hypothetical protein PoB_006819300 [Plakobranchus ocellatus]|uniref:Uncharacterized protein n=1 Tax=Plakobranchus ocellatus TaxID=259542 RepID=A0AAV4DBU9_9GAST|nr:hypothetical protein PoB_006819300 [Plakobranchus ocellatus]